MNRKSFLKRLGALVASTLIAQPILEALAADGPCCSKGLLWNIEHHANYTIYSPITNDMLNKLIEDLKASDYDFTLNPKLYEHSNDGTTSTS